MSFNSERKQISQVKLNDDHAFLSIIYDIYNESSKD